MAKNNIELSIGSTFDGEGFNKLNTALKTSGGNIRRVSGAVGKMIGSMEGMDGAVGKLTKTAGGLLGGFLSMGVWGLVIGAATSLFGWVNKIFEEERRTTEELDRMNNAWKTAEGRAAAYAKRLKEWRDLAKDRQAAEKNAAEAAKRAREAELKELEKREQIERDYEKYLMKVAELKERIAGTPEGQIAINSAKRELDFANKFGGRTEQTEAQLKLDLAKKKASDEFDKLADSIFEELDAQDRETAAAEAAAKAKEDEAKKQKEITAAKDAMAKKVKDLDERIAAAKKEAADLEANAARARGKSVGEWLRDERKLQRDQQKKERQQANRVKNAETELARLVRMSPKARNAWQNQRVKDLREWLADQDPNNNPKLKEAERLEKEKTDLIAKTQRDIADIAKTLKDNT